MEQIFEILKEVNEITPNKGIKNAREIYEELLKEVCYKLSLGNTGEPLKEVCYKSSLEDNAKKALKYLGRTDFYYAPSSTRYGYAYKGGLVCHTLKMAQKVLELSNIKTFSETVFVERALLLALVHDWGKIETFESYFRNVKDDFGNWTQKEEFKYKENPLFLFSKEMQTIQLANVYFNLDREGMYALEYVNGYYGVNDDSKKATMSIAKNTVPLVNLLQFADQLSLVEYSPLFDFEVSEVTEVTSESESEIDPQDEEGFDDDEILRRREYYASLND